MVLHFSDYKSIIFLMMLSVILLSMLMILLSALSAIRLQICSNELSSELESALRDIVDPGSKWIVDFNAAKTRLVSLDCLITPVVLI